MKNFIKDLLINITANFLMILVPLFVSSVVSIKSLQSNSNIFISIYLFIAVFSGVTIILYFFKKLFENTDKFKLLLRNLYKNSNDEFTVLYLFYIENAIELSSKYVDYKSIVKLQKRELVKLNFNMYDDESIDSYEITIELLDSLKKFCKRRTKITSNEQILKKYNSIKLE